MYEHINVETIRKWLLLIIKKLMMVATVLLGLQTKQRWLQLYYEGCKQYNGGCNYTMRDANNTTVVATILWWLLTICIVVRNQECGSLSQPPHIGNHIWIGVMLELGKEGPEWIPWGARPGNHQTKLGGKRFLTIYHNRCFILEKN
jgi:hypothetical protein